jgi:manganese transport protein
MSMQGATTEPEKVAVSHGGWLRRLMTFVGPAYLVSVGYMDPGNWATDIEAGSRFGYTLIWVLVLSNLMAILLQTLAARLGIVTGHDLAQGCGKEYPRVVRLVLWTLAELAIAATDLAEALGTIIGLNLLFHIPLLWGCAITALDTFLFLMLQHFGVRKLEAFIVVLVATIGACFMIEVFLSKPQWHEVAAGFIPHLDASMLYVAIGIIGATVMPHNLYLHSSLVQSRAIANTLTGKREACRFNGVDSIIALNAAFFVNAAILITAAAVFHRQGIVVTEIEQAHTILDNLLGETVAPLAFAVALLAAGQSSTITGTISGQVVMEGYLNLRLVPWVRRLVTRLVALAPAVVAISLAGSEGIYRLLVLSQVILSLQLPFAIVPLIHFTSDPQKMGSFANRRWVTVLAWMVAALVIALNANLVFGEIAGWVSSGTLWAWFVAIPAALLLGGFLLALVVWPWFRKGEPWGSGVATASHQVVSRIQPLKVHRVGAALQHSAGDSSILSAALSIAQANHAGLFLIHVVDSPGVMMLGESSASLHASSDEQYLEELAREVETPDLPVTIVLRFGRPADGLVRAVSEMRLDMLVLGSHGHRGIEDLVYGETVSTVRHRLRIPILVVHSAEPEPALHLP